MLEQTSHKLSYLKTEKEIDSSLVRDFLRTTDNFFAVVDREALISQKQVEAVLDHVRRNLHKKIRDPSTLLMLYISGQSQISKAIELTGINENTRRIVVIHHKDEDLERLRDLLPQLSMDAEPLPDDRPDMDSIVFGNIVRIELSL